MVARLNAAVLLLLSICFLNGCRNDLFGLFGSTDLDKRLKERNNFKFLQPNDRTLSLGNEYSFIVLNDTHIENKDAFGLEKLVSAIDSQIKFVVINGDITQCGYRQDIQKFIEIANSLGVPCYPVIGSHDIFFNNWSEWKKLIGSTRYRIDGGGATLFFLDSANAYLGKDQLDWLEKEMKNTQGRVFVFTHANLFVQGPVELQFTDTRERARLISIMKSHGDAMFMGRSHDRLISEAGGIPYITVEDYRTTRTYCRVSVNNNGISLNFKKGY